MTTVRVDALEVIYEDDDEGAVSSDGSDEEDYEDDDPYTSLHGHPDHLHSGQHTGNKRLSDGKVLQSLRGENKELRSHLTVLAREVDRANTELTRWRAKCRKLEGEKDALKQELDILTSTNSQKGILRDHPRLSTLYSTPSNIDDLERSNHKSSVRQQIDNNHNNSSQESQQGIPLHRGRLRQHANSDGSDNTHGFDILSDTAQQLNGDFNNVQLPARPLSLEAIPFSPSWLHPIVPSKSPDRLESSFLKGPVCGKQEDSDHDGQLSSDLNAAFLSSGLQRSETNSSVIAHDGHPAFPIDLGPPISPTSTIVPLSRQTSSLNPGAVQPIRPPHRKSYESLTRSASTTSTLSNSSSQASSVFSSVSPSSSSHIPPASYSPKYSPKKRSDTLLKHASLDLLPSMILPEVSQNGALAQTLRGRAKDILEGRASPGIVRVPEWSSNASSSGAAVSIHSVIENTIRGNIGGSKDNGMVHTSSKSIQGSLRPSTAQNGRSYRPTVDIPSIQAAEDQVLPLGLPIPNNRAPEKEKTERLWEPQTNGNGALRKVDNSQAGPINNAKGLILQPEELFSSNSKSSSFVPTNASQDYVDPNRNNNLMADLIVQSSPMYPYTLTNSLTMPVSINEENGFTSHFNAQSQFSRTLTPSSNTGVSVPINGTSLFSKDSFFELRTPGQSFLRLNADLAPIHNGNVATHSQVFLPSSNPVPVNVRPFSPDRIASSSPGNTSSIPGFPSTTVRSPPFGQFPPLPVLHDDPDYGPVIVHGPLPPRHIQHQHGHGNHHASPRRKREPVNVPPRHLGLSAGIPPAGMGSKRAGTGTSYENGSMNTSGGGRNGW